MAAPELTDRAGLIDQAARWLFDHPGHERPTLPALERYGLTSSEGIEAIRQSRQLWSEAMQEAAEHEEK